MNTQLKTKLLKFNTNILTDHPLKEYTTFNIGGPADFLIVTSSVKRLTETIKVCNEFNVPVKILGGGSNVLISDKGFRGVVIINRCSEWEVLPSTNFEVNQLPKTAPRLNAIGDHFYTTAGLDYSDEGSPKARVKVASGMRLIPFIKILFHDQITGLQWFSGIPASIGGAIYMNIHGGDYFFGDFVHSALLFDGQNIKRVEQDYFKFNYDWSILHDTKEIILEAELNLFKGDVEQAKDLSVGWARRKSLQPQKSVGCAFRNLSLDEQKKLDVPTSSVGYLIDQVLGLKGMQKGDAIISPNHAAFIENIGSATASDVYYLYNVILEKAKTQLGFDLIPEIEFIGDFT
jgi:UDP-N-acetylmuramate dehydrogenase